jgi:hypothetical protein
MCSFTLSGYAYNMVDSGTLLVHDARQTIVYVHMAQISQKNYTPKAVGLSLDLASLNLSNASSSSPSRLFKPSLARFELVLFVG